MRRRPAANSSMSLFPFLDTLVCTMGALILMLLAMTPKIKERALARQAAAQAPAVEPEPEPEPASAPEPPVLTAVPAGPSAEELAAERQRRRDAWLAQAADARGALGARTADFRVRRQQLKDAEQQLRDLQDQVLKTQLKTENVGQATETLEERAQRLEAQAAVIAQKIAATRKNIDLANRRQASAKNEYALVAYDGTSGTVRRPIYIECTGRGFRFLPEGETLSPLDLEGFSDNFNPLLAGAQSLVRFWARRKRSSGPAEPEPYVLLLVRPSGCFTYYLARKYLSPLGVLWGYELIEEDWKLSVPDPDPVAKSMLKEALDSTAQARRPSKRHLAAGESDHGGPFDPREFFDPDEGGQSFGGGAGGEDDSGFGRSGRGGGTGRRSPIKQGYATRNNRQRGDQFPDDGSFGSPSGAGGSSANPPGGIATAGARAGGGIGSGPGPGAGPAASGSAGGQSGAGRRAGMAKAAGISGGSRSGGGAGDGDGGDGGDGGDDDTQSFGGTELAANGPAGGGSGRPAGANGAQGGKTGTGATPGDLSGSGAAAGGDGTTPPGAGKRPAGSTGSGRARPASLGGSSDLAGDGKGGGAGDEPQPGGISDGDDELLMNPRGGSGGAPGKGGTAGQSTGSPGPATAGQLNAPGAADADSPPPAGATASNSPAGAAGASGRSGPPPSWLSDPTDGSAAASGSPRARMGGPGVSIGLGGRKSRKAANQDDDDTGPRIPEDQNGKPTNGPAARSRGPRKWGQVGRKAGIGFEKKIKIYLNDKRIVVDNKSQMFLVTPADSSEEIVNHVVASIDEVADTWGEPPSNFYWVPVVQFVVYPGGNTNYVRLQTALEQKWGVTSTVEYAADRKDKKPATGGHP
ncbi:MAG TPA: hypothetical protein VGM05_11910 [Planctomycetaceae bacterium]|jgi:hypothetical protein